MPRISFFDWLASYARAILLCSEEHVLKHMFLIKRFEAYS